MLFLFGKKAKVQPIEGGRVELRQCPKCEKTAQFIECEVTSSYSAFFVDVFDTKGQGFVCYECLEPSKLEDTLEPDPDSRAYKKFQKTLDKRAKQAAKERARQAKEAEEAARRAAEEEKRKEAQRQQDLEDQLAELKKRL